MRKTEKLVLRCPGELTSITTSPKIEKLLHKARRELDRLEAKLKRRGLSAQVSGPCRDTLLGLTAQGRTLRDDYARQFSA